MDRKYFLYKVKFLHKIFTPYINLLWSPLLNPFILQTYVFILYIKKIQPAASFVDSVDSIVVAVALAFPARAQPVASPGRALVVAFSAQAQPVTFPARAQTVASPARAQPVDLPASVRSIAR